MGQTLAFLDENGAPTSTYVEKTRVYVQVTDPAANVSPDKDEIEARLSTALGGDVELVTLTETGASTGIFRGDIALDKKGSSPQPGVLETDVLHDPPYGRDTIGADYGNGLATATASLVGSVTRFLDGYGHPATSFAIGETIFIRVVAPLRNDPNYIEDFLIPVGTGSDGLSVDVRETGVDTGVFEGSVATSGSSPVSGNNVLEAAPGQTAQATVSDPDNPTFSQANATLAASSVELIDARGNPAAFYLESSRAYVRVRDFAADLNPSVRDTTTVQMTADISGDQETVTLQETGTSTGVFEGSVPLRRGPGVPGNGTLETTASSSAPYRFDTVHATHSDSAGSSTDAVDMIGSLTFFLDGYGNEVSSYPEGARVYLRVEDHNFNDPSRFDTVAATVQSPGSGDAEGMTLVETGRDTGIFEGSIPTRTSSSGSGDGILTVQAGQTILAQHVDANNVLASGAQAAVQSYDIHFIEATGEPTLELVEDGTARVRVTCSVANVDPNLAETVTVHLQTLYSQDQEDLTLTETGPDTGVFEGSIRLYYATTGAPYNGVLETGNNNQSPIQPDEVTAVFPNVSATARVAGSRVWFIDDYGRTTTSFPVGGNVGVRVEKPAANSPGYWDQIYNFEIDVRDGYVTSSYYLNLNETGVDTGIFEGYIPSATTSNSIYVIRGAPGLPLQAISPGYYTFTPATADAVFTGGQVLFVDDQGQPASVYLEGTRAYVRVIDHQRAGSVSVTVTSEITGDQETFTLTETGGGSGVFEGSIALRKAAGAGTPGNGVLETGQDGGAVPQYDTIHASYTDSGNGTVSATASTLGYRVWFLDGDGNAVSSYTQEADVFVRIEDHNYDDQTNTVFSLPASVTSSSGDSESVLAQRSSSNQSFFQAWLRLANSGAFTTGDNGLIAPPGSGLTADLAGTAIPMPARAVVDSASVRIVDEVLAGGTARVRVVSPADNHSSTALETVTAQVSSRYKLDAETVTLTETGPDSGVFEGSIRLVYTQDGAIPGNGLLETGDGSPYPQPQPEEVVAAFGGYSAAAQVAGARVLFIDDFGQETAVFPVGANVGVRLIAPVMNANPGSYDTAYNVQIGVEYDAGLGSTGTTYYYLNLYETGPDTGIFEGRLQSSASSSSQTVIQASPGRALTIDYPTAYSPVAATARAAFTAGRVLFVDAQGQPANVFLESTRTYVRVVDPGANHSGGVAESVTVQLTTAVRDDQEILTLQETGPDTGIFEGSIPMQTTGTTVNNGILETGVENGPPVRYDTLTASYTDSGGMPETATASTLGYRVWFLDAAGNVVTSYVPGARAYVRLEDHNYNNETRNDILYVELKSSNGDQEFLEVDETGLSTGIYEGSIPLEFAAAATPGDGRLQASGGGWISADRQGPWFPAPVYARIDSASIEIVDAAGQPVSEVLENSMVHVRVNHPEANTNPSAVETVSAQLQSQRAGDQETVTLTETGPDTGIFEGSIQLRYGYSVSFGDGFLETANVQAPLHEEIQATYGAHSATATTIQARISFIGLRDQPVTSYALRSLVRLKVEDPIDNNPGQIDTLNVTVMSPETNDLEPITLTETGPDTGLFYGSLPSLETPGASYDGVLWAGADQTATAQFYGWAGQLTAQVSFSSNHVPVVQNESLTTNQDVPISFFPLANDSDPDGGQLSLAAVSQPAQGTVTVEPVDYMTYTPSPGTTGTDTFTYVVADEQGGEALGTVTVSVNGPPVANDDAASVDEDNSAVIPVLANDSDPQNGSLQLTITTPPANGTAEVNGDQTVTYTPAANFHGTDTFTYQIADVTVQTASATVTVTVNSINDLPVAIGEIWSINEDQTAVLTVLYDDTDPDGDALTIASVTQPAQGTIQINPDQTLTYTPPLNFTGDVTFTYTVSDGNGGTATATSSISVYPVNDPPVANADAATVTEDGTVDIAVLANDTDVENGVLTVASVTQGAHGTVAINPDKTVKYTPAANYNGSDSFTYMVLDGNGGSATGTVTITVSSVNDAPIANADAATVAEDGTVDVAVLGNDTDADGDTLSVSSVTQGAHGTVAINPDETVSYTPAANYNGPDSFTYTVSDGNGGSATGTVTITVSSANDAPVANADAATVTEDGSVNVAVLGNDTDADGDTLSVSSVTQGAHGAVAINPDKTVSYTPAANYNGSDSFTYTVSDGNGGTSSAAVVINVTAVNDAPVAVNDSASVVTGSAVTVSVLANDADVDGPGLSVTSVTQGAHGTAAINPDQTVTYTAALYVGTDSFTYTVSDGAGGTATATVNVTITAPARVTAGIQARYDFNEGSGSTVSDTSGVGTPLNLTIASPSSVTWVSGGLRVNTATAVSTSGFASKIINAAKASNEITVEAWVSPSSLTLTGPARIATITKNPSQRNLVFGQSDSRYESRIKTTAGTSSLQSPASSLTQSLTHVVYMRSSSGAAVWYINGVQVSTQTTTGNLSTWGTDQKLTLADNWQGSYYLLAVYGRALSASEVQQNYLAGVGAN